MDSLWAVLDSIPEGSIAVTVYLLGSFIALLCWYGLMKRLPKAIGWHWLDYRICHFINTNGI